MAAMGGGCFVVGASATPRAGWFRQDQSYPLAASTTRTTTTITTTTTTRVVNIMHELLYTREVDNDGDNNDRRNNWREYFELANMFINSTSSIHGPPRWFSPLETGSHNNRLHNSPLLLYLPGIDGLGAGLALQHQKLGKIFDVWCLHIPVKDRTPFQELVLLVEETVRSENRCFPGRPVYLVGESVGGCLALAVAARNPDIDLVLILANPATSYSNSQLQPLLHLLEVIPSELSMFNILHTLGQMTGVENRSELKATLDELFPTLGELSSYSTVLADVLPRDTLVWKLQMMKSAGLFANSRLHAVKAQILILASGRDPLLPNFTEAERIRGALPKQEVRLLDTLGRMPKCEIRKFANSGHFLFLEDGVDLVTIIKGTSLYRRAAYHDYVNDYFPLTKAEFKKTSYLLRWFYIATAPVMLSTLENGEITRGLAGIPSEGPVLLVGYHTFLALEIFIFWKKFTERGIIGRGLAHPLFFTKLQEDELVDISIFDVYRLLGGIPVTATNLYKLLSSRSHIFLFPGGIREGLHKKGEAYQLFWPERPEFVRMAARFGAKIIPFGTVGEDDISEIVFDYDDQMKIPYLREIIEKRLNPLQLRTDSEGELADQAFHLPGFLPKLPGRYYCLFGKPIDTAEMKMELKDREKAQELYLQVKSEVERCITYLKEKRGKDPYRSLVARLLYQTMRGSMDEDDIPSFEL